MASRKQLIKDVQEATRIAQESFGFDALGPGQQAAIRSLLAGRDTLAVMPTGSGKSAIYQIPALIIPGPTVIVSPLLALQRDQLDSLQPPFNRRSRPRDRCRRSRHRTRVLTSIPSIRRLSKNSVNPYKETQRDNPRFHNNLVENRKNEDKSRPKIRSRKRRHSDSS